MRDARYLDVLPLPGGGHRLWYEARLLIDKPMRATAPSRAVVSNRR